MQSKLSESQLRERIATLEKAIQPPPPGVQAVAAEITQANIHLLERLRIELLLIEDISKIPLDRLESKKDFIKSAQNPDYNPIITRYEQEIQHRRTAPVTPPPAKPTLTPIKHTAPPPPALPAVALAKEDTHIPIEGIEKSEIRNPKSEIRISPQQLAAFENTPIEAQNNATPPTVTIHWPDTWGTRTYTEREARGRFSSELTALTESKRAGQGRYDNLPLEYDTWWRAVNHYRALTIFWNTPPTRRQLQLRRQDTPYIEIFDRITAAASTHEKTPAP